MSRICLHNKPGGYDHFYCRYYTKKNIKNTFNNYPYIVHKIINKYNL